MRATRRLINNGKVTIPVHIRDELAIGDGDLVEIDVQAVENGSNQ
ncbi:AbrB/MazE/SpoVT family DNA-binding domain-containing protein [Halococcus saccharolyticus]|uniref:SpoVT-AbrB domain-containing protein n=1 Tax=Halococcus saccharolyticus DSM 5350 TaxID=1227455 RepID=M0MIJ9_9EURY|nr:AbrB/MazE/SpoVT family DNA-binding domain-containing protein [Halococcus saccharolyticus]EMA44280.1 hypothetical protein C449_12158 [Halococcus saccharolyticus DSM 5350]